MGRAGGRAERGFHKGGFRQGGGRGAGGGFNGPGFLAIEFRVRGRRLGQGGQVAKLAQDFAGQIVNDHFRAVGQDAQALHEIFQLAHVARPGIGGQGLLHVGA